MSDQTTTDNFLQAWAMWDRTEPPPVFFRLYHSESGEPLFYSMEDLPGNYIEIDQATYALQSYDVRVINGKVQTIDRTKHVSKLRPAQTQGAYCDPRDVCVIVPESQTHTRWKKIP